MHSHSIFHRLFYKVEIFTKNIALLPPISDSPVHSSIRFLLVYFTSICTFLLVICLGAGMVISSTPFL
jgi:hypothetical protein